MADERQGRAWFITGASRGLGRAFAEAALAAGDRVVGTARDVGPLAELAVGYQGRLLALELDIADRAAVHAVVDKAVAELGGLDIVVNNAGQLLYGMLEEATEEQVRAHFDTNVHGALWVGQAVLPYLREQGSGHVVQVTSMGSTGGFASVGLYSAGKAALDALSEALAMEVESFGVSVTIVQPGSFATDLFTRGTTMTEERGHYAPLRAKLAELWADADAGEPAEAAAVLLRAIEIQPPPKRLILGSTSYDLVLKDLEARIGEHRRWEELSRQAGQA
ncbi:short-chain dehydrogenase [Prauserella marina]|nr:short-chain dehydrogenase [Prauserella marina]